MSANLWVTSTLYDHEPLLLLKQRFWFNLPSWILMVIMMSSELFPNKNPSRATQEHCFSWLHRLILSCEVSEIPFKLQVILSLCCNRYKVEVEHRSWLVYRVSVLTSGGGSNKTLLYFYFSFGFPGMTLEEQPLFDKHSSCFTTLSDRARLLS